MTADEIFQGTGIKRYSLRYKSTWSAPFWEYMNRLAFDTAEEAAAAIPGETQRLPGVYQVVELWPGAVHRRGKYHESKLLSNILAAANCKPYMLQGHEGFCLDRQFDTLEEARAACDRRHWVVAAGLKVEWRPLED